MDKFGCTANSSPHIFSAAEKRLHQHQPEQQNHQQKSSEALSTTANDMLAQMQQVGKRIGANKFSTLLGDQIYEICIELRARGKELEQNSKDELDAFFASLRLASCRESGELGLPCRLKILELLEIRLMGWRSNLPHARYYARKERELEEWKEEEEDDRGVGGGTGGISRRSTSTPASPHSLSPKRMASQKIAVETTPSSPMHLLTTNPCSPSVILQQPLPPHLSSTTTTTSNSPCAFFQQSTTPKQHSSPLSHFCVPPPPLLLLPQLPSAAPPLPPSNNYLLDSPGQHPNMTGFAAPSGFFFVPSQSGTFVQAPIVSSHGGIFSSPPPPLLPPHFPQILPTFFKSQHQMSSSAKSFTPSFCEFEAMPSQQRGGKTVSAALFREEISIRNADSGKVMGMKGRRVALIEEASNTVISFQKVDAKCQDRQLTVIAESRSAIECAKRLIADTIERNVSPEQSLKSGSASNEFQNEAGKTLELGGSFRMMREEDGSLRIASFDASLLPLAQEAVVTCLKQFARESEQEDESAFTNPNNEQQKKCANGNREIPFSPKYNNSNGTNKNEEEFQSKLESATTTTNNTNTKKQIVYDRSELLEIREALERNNSTFLAEAGRQFLKSDCDIFCSF